MSEFDEFSGGFDDGTEFDEGDPYEQAGADLDTIHFMQRGQEAANVEAFNEDIRRAAKQHGLSEPDDDSARALYLAMRGQPDFSRQGVERFVEQAAHEQRANLRETIRTGRDPESGEWLSERELRDAKMELFNMNIRPHE